MFPYEDTLIHPLFLPVPRMYAVPTRMKGRIRDLRKRSVPGFLEKDKREMCGVLESG